jgi:hypothetical protein
VQLNETERRAFQSGQGQLAPIESIEENAQRLVRAGISDAKEFDRVFGL